MDILKAEIESSYTKIYTRLYTRAIIIKLVSFIILFSAAFWYIRVNNLLPDYKLEADLRSIPTLFGAGNLIFSVIGGFIIQTQWSKWSSLVEATRGEITALRQLFVLAHHFPVHERNEIRFKIYLYLRDYIEASDMKNFTSHDAFMKRSEEVDNALYKLEDKIFNTTKKYQDIGQYAFGYLTRAMEFREQKLQNTAQRLPQGIRLFISFATGSVIIGSLFVPFVSVGYNYYFALVVGLLAYGIYLIIDDFDHPYRPGNFVLHAGLHQRLLGEIKEKLQEYHFDIDKAEQKEVAEAI